MNEFVANRRPQSPTIARAALALALGLPTTGCPSDDGDASEGTTSGEGTEASTTQSAGATGTPGDGTDASGDGSPTTDASSTSAEATSNGTTVGDGGTTDDGDTTGDTTGDSETNGDTTGGVSTNMSFFVSSTALSGTGDLGGLAAADAHCQALAEAAGSDFVQWVAYLSTEGGPGPGDDVNAIDRIGTGPWFNADGEMFAADLDSIHTIEPDIIACDGGAPPGCMEARAAYILLKPADELFLDENGVQITDPLQPANLPVPNGGDRGHDIFTGSLPDGTVFPGGTCNDWTSAAGNEFARVGHTDVPGNTQFSPSWNAAHDTVDCSLGGVESRGGAGFFYCFAAD